MRDLRQVDHRDQPATSEQDKPKLQPYTPPSLRFYGAVRDLTLGGGSENGEGGAFKIKNP
jgi:hypothetical protein